MRRRALLATLGTALLAVPGLAWLAGSRPRPTELAELEVVDYHDRPHTVELRIRDGDDVIYERSVDLAAAPSAVPPGSPTRATLIDFPTRPGTCTVRARLDGAPTEGATVDFGAYDAPCIGLDVHVGGPERSDARISIWHTSGPDDC